MRVRLFIATAALGAAISANAQATTAEEVAQAFRYSLITYCAPSVASDIPLTKWTPEQLGGLKLSSNPKARALVVAGADDTVWDVPDPAWHRVFIVQSPSGDCRVTAFGPPVQPVLDATAGALQTSPYSSEPFSVPDPAVGPAMWMTVTLNGRKMVVHMEGVDADTSGNAGPPFSVIYGFVNHEGKPGE